MDVFIFADTSSIFTQNCTVWHISCKSEKRVLKKKYFSHQQAVAKMSLKSSLPSKLRSPSEVLNCKSSQPGSHRPEFLDLIAFLYRLLLTLSIQNPRIRSNLNDSMILFFFFPRSENMKTYLCSQESFLSLLVGFSFGAFAEITGKIMDSLSKHRAIGKTLCLGRCYIGPIQDFQYCLLGPFTVWQNLLLVLQLVDINRDVVQSRIRE